MTTLCDIKILELRLQVNATVLNDSSVLIQILPNLVLFFLSAFQIFASCSNCVILSYWLYRGSWILIDALLSESQVDCVAECRVAKMTVFIVLLSKRLELSFGEREIEHGEDSTELRNSDLALAELIEITEEFLNSHSFHDNEGLEAGLNI